ncbi:MAG: hypothetical protein U0359_17840 [Byssovorax sp.]
MPHRRRIWCETLPPEDLCAPATIALLRRYSLAPIVAVFPTTSRDVIARVIAAYAAEGLPAAVWPMLDDRDGRWASAGNAAVFCRFAGDLIGDLAARGQRPAELFVDLEPAIEAMKSSVASRAVNMQVAHYLPETFDARALDAARASFSTLAAALRARGVRPSAAVAPMVLLDPERGPRRPWEDRLGTPVEGVGWSHLSVMLYTSIFEGWSRGALRRDDTRQLLALAAAETARRYRERGSLCLGAVGTGAFGDEPVYRDVGELADDVGIALAAGVDDLSLFDLGGVLRRGSPEVWLDAFTQTKPALHVPAPGLRLRSLLAGARLAGGVLGFFGALRAGR